MENIEVDVCIIGCGAGGFGAARSALDQGLTVAVVDRNPGPGGMNVFAYVSQWPTGPGESIAKSLFNDMNLQAPNNVAVGQHYDNNIDKAPPAGLWFNAETNTTWEDTLNTVKDNKIINKEDVRIVIYDPSALENAMNHQFKAYGSKVRLLFNTVLTDVQTSPTNDSIEFVNCINSQTGTIYEISATVFIDATSTLALSKLSGCQTVIGNEPSGCSDLADSRVVINGASLCYKLVKTNNSSTSTVANCEDFVFSGSGANSAYVTGLKGGNIYVTPLQYSVLDGSSILSNFNDEMLQFGKGVSACNWKWLQGVFNTAEVDCLDLNGYELQNYAPMLYIRESYRIISEYILSEEDILDGLQKQYETCKDIVALDQHLFDFHPGPYGNDHISFVAPGNVTKTYGVPYRTMVPNKFKNMLVACTGSGFSHMAATSARLQRMLMGLGHAAGYAAALAIQSNPASIDMMNVYNDSTMLDALVSEMQTAYQKDSSWKGGPIND